MNIRVLRLRLGWSQSELARQLCCRSSDIEMWESGQAVADHDSLNKLEFLARQVEMCCDEVKAAPAAENLLDEKSLGQVDFVHIKERDGG